LLHVQLKCCIEVAKFWVKTKKKFKKEFLWDFDMAQKLAGANDAEKLANLATKTYKDQAVWFLNAFWEQYGKDAEKFWDYKHKMDELDLEKKNEGSGLDEVQAHRFLEKFNETLTVTAMREKLRSTGAIGDRVKLVPLIHILIFKYGVDWRQLVNAPQGSKEEIDKAQKMLDEVQSAFREAEKKDQEAAAALREAQAKEAEAKQREDELRAAKQELENALAELKAQEDAYNNKTQHLKDLSENSTSIIAKNKAKNELAQHLNEDPLPLRKAKITQEAAVKKADKATQVAAEARARVAEARKKSEQAKAAAEAAVDEARKRLEEAEAYLEKAKNSLPKGAIWWLERELHEARAYLPTGKGGYAKKKVV